MAVAREIGVCDLLPEFLADALIFLGALQTAGAVAAGALQAVLHHLDDLLILVQPYSHTITSFLKNIIAVSVDLSRKERKGRAVEETGRKFNSTVIVKRGLCRYTGAEISNQHIRGEAYGYEESGQPDYAAS